MACAKLQEHLDRLQARYVSIKHSPAFTAQEIAAAAHVPGWEMAKTVVVKLDGKMALVAVPAPSMVRLNHLKAATGASSVELASEQEFKESFPDCEVGAMPPVGLLYGMETFVDRALSEREHIVFNAGTHTEVIRMSWEEYQRIAQPRILAL